MISTTERRALRKKLGRTDYPELLKNRFPTWREKENSKEIKNLQAEYNAKKAFAESCPAQYKEKAEQEAAKALEKLKIAQMGQANGRWHHKNQFASLRYFVAREDITAPYKQYNSLYGAVKFWTIEGRAERLKAQQKKATVKTIEALERKKASAEKKLAELIKELERAKVLAAGGSEYKKLLAEAEAADKKEIEDLKKEFDELFKGTKDFNEWRKKINENKTF